MPGAPPRIGTTLALTLAWLALYVLWLAVRPDEPARPGRPATTTTSVTRGSAPAPSGWPATAPAG